MRTRRNLKNIDDVMKIHNSLCVVFGPRVSTHTVGMNAYLGPKIKHLPLTTPNYGLGNTKYNMNYCGQSYRFPENLEITRPTL